MMRELNELHTTGLYTPEFYTQELKKTRFQEHFRVVEHGQEDAKEYYRKQQMKFMILYKYFKPYAKESKDEKECFFEKLANKLETTKDDGINLYGSEIDISITFTLLDKLKRVAPDVLEDALMKIYHTIFKLKSHLIDTDDYKFYAREEILNEHRNYLIDLINEEGTEQKIKELALRLIILIGNLRSSGEDFLVAYNLIVRHQLNINLNAELSMNRCFLQKSTSQNNQSVSFRVNDRTSSKIVLLLGEEYKIKREDVLSFGFDGRNLFIDVKDDGVFRIGLLNSASVSPGTVYTFNDDIATKKLRSMICINSKLYTRDDESQTEKVLVLYDKYTLRTLEPESHRSKFLRNQRNHISDDWNRKLFEITDSQALEVELSKGTLPEYRSVLHTPVFTDSKYIYIIATYHKPQADENQSLEFEVEVYHPETWELTSSHRLILEPEETTQDPDTVNKITEDTETIKSLLSKKEHLLSSLSATDGNTFMFGSHGKMYFFDLKTGRRHPDVVDIPKTTGGYNPYTNEFWFFDEHSENSTIKSFTIDGIRNSGGESKSNKGMTERHSIEIVQKVLENQDDRAKEMSSRNMASFLRGLCTESSEKPKLSALK